MAVDDDGNDTDCDTDIPITPESASDLTKRAPTGVVRNTPSMLCTVPVTTQQLTNALPVFTNRNRDIQQALKCTSQATQFGAKHTHTYVAPNVSCITPKAFDTPIMRSVEGVLHQWHDSDAGDRWPPSVSEWPMSSQWDFQIFSEQQSWDWMQDEQSYYGAWNVYPSSNDAVPNMAWTSPTGEAVPTSAWNGLTGETHLPTYIPVMQNVTPGLPGAFVAHDAEQNSVVAPPKVGKKILPPGVEIVVDTDPPPLAPAATQ